jgi:pyruvate,orthophosphate dikinase
LIVARDLPGVDVPKGFGLCTQTWAIVEGSKEKKKALEAIIRAEVEYLEQRTHKRFGDPSNPLILIARSGAVVSMPGILPTVAHIGLNEQTVEKWASTLKQPHRAYHAYIRFLFNYAEDVFRDSGLKRESLYRGLETKRTAELCVEDIGELRETIKTVKQNIKAVSGGLTVPDDVYEQLFASVRANFSSYKSDLVVSHHRELRSIPAEYQSACLIQDCLPVIEDTDCSGIYLTRNPLDGGTGQIEYIYDFGEDLAGGRAKPGSNETFRKTYPAQDKELTNIGRILEEKYASPMDIEFAIRNGRLHILQARSLTLAPMAEVVTNYKIYQSGLMSESELIKRTRRIVGKPLINTFLKETDKHCNTPIANGQPIAGGVVAGRVISDVAHIEKYPNEHIIFITKSNVPREVGFRSEIDGYISEEGGVTSHAALVSIGKIPCIVGVKWRKFGNRIFLGDTIDVKEGDVITLDANDGYIYRGKLPIQASSENDPEYLEAEKAILEIYRKAEEHTIMPSALY